MSTRAERLIALLEALRARRSPVTAGELARRFAVSERTIYRDMTALARQGASIEGSAGVGYRLKPGYFLPPLMFGPEEADALALGLRFVVRRADDSLAAAARSAFAKLDAMLPAGVARRARSNGLVVAPSSADGQRTIAVVRSAIERGCKMVLNYVDLRGAVSQRTVWPIALGFFDRVEVLAAWCELRGDHRHFRIDRVRDARLVRESPPVPHPLLLSRWRATEPGVEL